MGYFPNGTAGMIYEGNLCCMCAHWPKKEDGPGCPVMLIHNLYNYDQCEQTDKGAAIETILGLLIPRAKGDLDNERCTMFLRRDGLTARHLKDWEKYKAAMAEADAAKSRGIA